MNIDQIDYKVTVFLSDYNIQVDIIDADSVNLYKLSDLKVEYSQFHAGYEIKSNKTNYKKVLEALRVKKNKIKEISNPFNEFNEISTYVY